MLCMWAKGRYELVTKAAFAVWDERIAPVFDVARHVRVLEADGGRILRSETAGVPAGSAPGKAEWLASRGIAVLVCGAISRLLHGTIAARGIEVIPFIAGDVREIEQAWLAGALREETFAMPGCRRRGRGFRPGGAGKEGGFMPGQGRGGAGGGGGRRGAGGRGGGAGRMGGGAAGGPGGACVCPSCGHREPHQRGIPCNKKQCPKCGTALTRE